MPAGIPSRSLLVGDTLSLNGDLVAGKAGKRAEAIQRQIDSTDAEIDRLVYELYRLTAAEIAMAEELAH